MVRAHESKAALTSEIKQIFISVSFQFYFRCKSGLSIGIGFSGISDPGTRTGNESGTRVPVRFFVYHYVSNNAVCEKLCN
jgi:hypothetical protein